MYLHIFKTEKDFKYRLVKNSKLEIGDITSMNWQLVSKGIYYKNKFLSYAEFQKVLYTEYKKTTIKINRKEKIKKIFSNSIVLIIIQTILIIVLIKILL